MTVPMKYPLEQVLDVKRKRVEDQEKVVNNCVKQLEMEQQKLKEREAERDKVKQHYKDKLQQLRNEMDTGTTTDKIQQMKAYIKVVIERVATEEKKVQDQKAMVAQAEKNLEAAKDLLKQRRQEVDKLLTHKKDWEREMRQEMEIIEGREQDEVGTVIFISRRRGN